jgi:GNAT superfamily N-acetyltransferase
VIEIEALPEAMATDQRFVEGITDLVNRVYETAEAGLWVPGATRTTSIEMREMIAAGQIAVARISGQMVGCIRIKQLDDRVGEFGLLAARPDHRGVGIGRALVRFAEDRSRQHGLAVMQLELLMPRGWSHPVKDFLHAWYTRIGYQPVRKGSIEESYPHLAPLLATPCDLVAYHKRFILQRRRESMA